VSLFSKIAKVGKNLISKVAPLASLIPGPIGTGIKAAGMLGMGSVAASTGRAVIGAIPRALPGIGKIGGAVMRSPTVRGIAAGAAGSAIFDAAGNYLGQGRRKRSINPLNYKALKRAMSRIERSKKLTKRLNAITIRKEKC